MAKRSGPIKGGTAKRRKRYTDVDRERIRMAFIAGGDIRAVARELGVPEGTALSWAMKDDWSGQRAAVRQLVDKSLADRLAITADPTKCVTSTLRQKAECYVGRLGEACDRFGDHVASLPSPELLVQARHIESLDKVARRTFGLDVVKSGEGSLISIGFLMGRPDAPPPIEAVESAPGQNSDCT
jgi:hypothetical protein